LKLTSGTTYAYPRVSPDGRRVALESRSDKDTNISIYELSGSSAVRRLTFDGNNRFPVRSADGRRVACQSDRDGDASIFWQRVDGGSAERLTKAEPGTAHVPESWSPKGDVFLFSIKSPVADGRRGRATAPNCFSCRRRDSSGLSR
jgi:eukaryotic-like serine/threonine-protein kinase